MSVVGEAKVFIRPITNTFASELKKGLSAAGKTVESSGKNLGDSFTRSFSRQIGRRQMFGPTFFRQADAARKQLLTLIRTGYALGPILAFLGGSVAALGASFFSLASAVGAAAPALIVLPASMLAVAQAAVVLKAAFAGVGKAISAGLSGGGGGGGAAQAEAIKNALERVQDARERLARAYEDAAERTAEANKKVTQAEEDYQDAQGDSVKAANELSRARQEAIEDLQQLRFETEDAAISEGKARLEFEKSRDSLQRVQDLPPNSRARREAELAFAEADLNLRRAIDTNADLKKAEAAATAAGVEGSDKVLSAKEDLANAKQREADAANAVAEAVADAAKVERDAARGVADAQRDLARALDDAEAAKKKSAGGANAYADALSKLSPAAQDFVKYMVGTFIPTLKEIRDVAATNLFPKLEVALENLRTKLFTQQFKDNIAGTASVLGDVAIELSNVVTKGENVAKLDRIWETNDGLIRNFGSAAGNLYEIFLTLLDAARPLITEFGNWAKNVTDAWKNTLNAKSATGELQTAFKNAGDVAKDIIQILKDVATGLFNMGKAAMGPGSGGQMLIDAMKEGAAKFKEFTGSADGQNKLEKYFQGAATNALAVASLIGEIAKQIGRLGDNEGIGIMAGKFETAATIFGDAFDQLTDSGLSSQIGDLAINLAELFEAFTDAGSIEVFFSTLNTLIDPIVEFFKSDFGQQLISQIGPILAVINAISLAGTIALFFFKGIIGSLGSLFTIATTLSTIFFGKARTELAIFYVQYYLYEAKLWAQKALSSTLHWIAETAKSAAFWVFDNTKSAASWVAKGIASAAHWAAETAKSAAFWVIENAKIAASWVARGVSSAAYWVAENGRALAYWVAMNAKAAAFFTFAILRAVALNAVMLLNPVFLIAAAIGLIIAAIVIAYNKYKPFRDAVQSTWEFIKKIVDGIKSVGGLIAKAFGKGGGGGGGGSATEMAEGGVVKPSRYGTLAVIGEAGRSERVEPLDPNGLSNRDKALISFMSNGSGGGPTINVYPSEGMDEKELAAMVSRQLAFQMRKGSM